MLTSPGLTMLGFFLVDFPGTIWLAQLNPAVPRFEGVVGGRINVKVEHPVAHPGASGADSPPGEMLDFAEIIFVIYGLWKRSWWKHFLHGVMSCLLHSSVHFLMLPELIIFLLHL